jgi:hypothetical protein
LILIYKNEKKNKIYEIILLFLNFKTKIKFSEEKSNIKKYEDRIKVYLINLNIVIFHDKENIQNKICKIIKL